MNIINIWQTNLIAYLISVTLFYHFYKFAVKNSSNENASTILLQVIAGSVVLLLMPSSSLLIPKDPRIYLLTLAASIFFAVNNRLQTTVRKHLEVSTFTILNQLTQVFTILISLFILGESIVSQKILGAGLIFLGNTFLILKTNYLKLNKYIILSILSTLSAAIGISLGVAISKEFNLSIYVSLTFILPAVIISLFSKTNIYEILKIFSANKKDYILTGVFWALSVFFSLKALQLGEVSIVVPLQTTAILINIAVAYIFLREREHTLIKIAAAVIIILGASAQINIIKG